MPELWRRFVSSEDAYIGLACLLVALLAYLVHRVRLGHGQRLELERLNVELGALYENARDTLAEAIPQLVWTATPDGSLDYENQRCIDYLGGRKLGWEWLACIEATDREVLLQRWGESLATGEAYEMECRIRRADGEHRWFLIRALPLRAGATLVKWFGTATDIHHQKLLVAERERLLERAREEVRARDVFLAIAAHELRTPLTPLRFEIEGLQRAAGAEGLATERLRARLSVADRQLGRLERLVTNLLDVSRLTTGQFELHREPTDLAELVRRIAARHAPDLAAAGCELELRLDGPVVGPWDGPRLDEVVTSLLGNAIIYGRGKPIAVQLSATAAEARLEVRDQGAGIAPEDQARIFGRFERASAERHTGGLGLGLWLVREIVEAHGGSAHVESRPPDGSTFIVELPRR